MYPFDAAPVFGHGRYQDQMDYTGNMQAYRDVYQNMRTNQTEVLKLIREAVEGEKEDREFYEALKDMAASQEDMDIITGIRQNEMKHNRMFKDLYFELTGRNIEPETAMLPTGTAAENLNSYCDGLKKALMGEQRAVEKYRRILFAMTERKHINMMTEIITDELRHLGLYNYLYAKNGCSV